MSLLHIDALVSNGRTLEHHFMTFEGKFVRYCTKQVVTGSTVVDAINGGDSVDPEGRNATMKTGVATRASVLRNHGNRDSEET